MDKTKNLIWIDLEMTGLHPHTDVILEIASIITDSQLNELAQGPELVIHQPEEKLQQMNQEVRKMHTTSGLLEKVRASTTSIEHAEQQTLEF